MRPLKTYLRGAALVVVLAAIWATSVSAARADQRKLPWTFGLASVAETKPDQRKRWVPELMAQTYLGLPALSSQLLLRPGVRVWYAGIGQQESAAMFDFRRDAAGATAELGLVFDGPVVPSLTVGIGAGLVRHRRAVGAEVEGSLSPRIVYQGLVKYQAQLGVGLPTLEGRLMLEPFVRLARVGGNSRMEAVQWGLEITWCARGGRR